jgi:hypothetical protein
MLLLYYQHKNKNSVIKRIGSPTNPGKASTVRGLIFAPRNGNEAATTRDAVSAYKRIGSIGPIVGATVTAISPK